MKCVVEWMLNEPKDNQPIEIKGILLMQEHGEVKLLSSVDELVKILPTIETPILFVRNLKQMFRFIEPALLRAGYIPKMCADHGNGFYPWPAKIKTTEYAPVIKGNRRDCLSVKFSNFKMYNADPWLGNTRNAAILLQSNEVDYLLMLSTMSELKSTPSGNAWKDFRKKAPYYIDNTICYDIEMGVCGGIIYGCRGFYKKAYHYDVTSMYPYIITSITYMPDPIQAVRLTRAEKADHKKYAYWVGEFCHCDVESEYIPAGSIKMPLVVPNRYAVPALQLYQQKALAKKGTLQYTVAKLMVNSFIGRIIMKEDISNHYRYTDPSFDDVKDKVVAKVKHPLRPVEVYTYIIALARQYINHLMKRAIAEGCRIIQVNTDGFFTDKPISFADDEKFLGSLRFEYEAHNLTIFACNQYVCDEETCIAGLPKELYKPGQVYYEFPIITVKDTKTQQLIWRFKTVTLGAEE